MTLRSLSAKEARDALGVETIHRLNDQLLIVALNRLGGSIDVPCAELDATGDFIARLAIDQVTRVFTLKIERKQ